MYSQGTPPDDITEFEHYSYSNADAIWQTPDLFAMDIDPFFYRALNPPAPFFSSYEASFSAADYHILETGQAPYAARLDTGFCSSGVPGLVRPSEVQQWIPQLLRESSPGDTASSLSAVDCRPVPYDFTSYNPGNGCQVLDEYSSYPDSAPSPQVFHAFVPKSELACATPSLIQPVCEICLSDDYQDHYGYHMRQRIPHDEEEPWIKPKKELQHDSPASHVTSKTNCKTSRKNPDQISEEHDPEYKPGRPRQGRESVRTHLIKTPSAKNKRSIKTIREWPLDVTDSLQHKVRITRCARGTGKPKCYAKPRPYECSFSPYGCSSNFPSKNEWKRHIKTKHLQLDCWRCDLCPHSDQGSNIFNRIDLFVSHLRRGHQTTCKKLPTAHCEDPDKIEVEDSLTMSDPRSKSGLDDPAKDKEDIGQRCYIPIRKPPTEASCVLCEKQYHGENSTEDWLEHVGRHLGENNRKNPSSPTSSYSGNINWLENTSLWTWLVNEELLNVVPGSSDWTIASKQDLDRAAENACLIWALRRTEDAY